MEDLLASFSKVGEADNNQQGESIDGSYSPEPIRSIDNEMEVSRGRVDVKSIIGTSDEDVHFDDL